MYSRRGLLASIAAFLSGTLLRRTSADEPQHCTRCGSELAHGECVSIEGCGLPRHSALERKVRELEKVIESLGESVMIVHDGESIRQVRLVTLRHQSPSLSEVELE
jgi:hypothetical protein